MLEFIKRITGVVEAHDRESLAEVMRKTSEAWDEMVQSGDLTDKDKMHLNGLMQALVHSPVRTFALVLGMLADPSIPSMAEQENTTEVPNVFLSAFEEDERE